MEYDRVSLEDWQRNQPLSVLQLDKADRVVLRIAGKVYVLCTQFDTGPVVTFEKIRPGKNIISKPVNGIPDRKHK